MWEKWGAGAHNRPEFLGVSVMGLVKEGVCRTRTSLALISSFALVASMAGCGLLGGAAPDGGDEDRGPAQPVAVILPAPSPAEDVAQQAMAIAIQQYVYARLLTEQFITMDFDGTVSEEEVAAVLDQSTQAWDNAAALLESAAAITDSAQLLLDADADTGAAEEEGGTDGESAGGQGEATPGLADLAQPASLRFGGFGQAAAPLPTNPRFGPLPADPSNDPQTWAENFLKQYDSIDNNQKLRTLAQQMNTDVANVHDQLELAKEIVFDGAMKSADRWEALQKAAMATKTAAKVGLFVTATVVTAGGTLGALATGSATLVQAGGILVSGVDVVIEVGATTSAIVLGEDHKVTAAMTDFQNVTGPIAAGFGVVFPNLGSSDSAVGGAVTALGGLIMDYLAEGRIAGWMVKKAPGKPQQTKPADPVDPAKPTDHAKPTDPPKTATEVTPSKTAPPLEAGETEVTMASVPAGEDAEETNRNPEAAGLPRLPTDQPATTLEQAAAAVEVDVEAAKARMEELERQIEDALVQVQSALVAAAIARIPGTYTGTETVNTDGEITGPYTFPVTITMSGTDMTIAFGGDREDILTGTFGPETATFVGMDLNTPPEPGPEAGNEENLAYLFGLTNYMLVETTVVFDMYANPVTAAGGHVFSEDTLGMTWTSTRDLTFVKTGN